MTYLFFIMGDRVFVTCFCYTCQCKCWLLLVFLRKSYDNNYDNNNNDNRFISRRFDQFSFSLFSFAKTEVSFFIYVGFCSGIRITLSTLLSLIDPSLTSTLPGLILLFISIRKTLNFSSSISFINHCCSVPTTPFS